MGALPLRRLTTRARSVTVALAFAGVLSLLLPTVAAASSGHGGGGGGLFVAPPMASIFSDILGSVSGFGKDIVKTIFSSVLTLFFGGSWKVLLHPYEIVEWLIGLPGTGNTTAFVPFGNNGAGPFAALVKDTQAIGLGLLPLALANNTLHLVSGGIFTRPRDHMNDFGKVFMAACAIIAWPWLFGQAIVLANTVTLALLQAANADGNLWKTLGAYFVTAWAGGFLDLLTTGFLIATALLLVGLIVMKIVLMVSLAFLLVVGPVAIAFYPFEFLSRILMLFGTVFLALAMVPLGWAVLFALFTAFGASVFGFSNFIHAGLIGGTMTDTFDLICSLICFYLAWKWPFIIIGRVTSIVGGNIAAAGEAFSAFGHRGGAGAAAAAAGAGGRGGAVAGMPGSSDAEGGMLAGKLAGLGGVAQGLGTAGGGVLAGLGSSPATYAGYGLGAKGVNALRAASSAVRRNGSAPASTAGGPVASSAGSVGEASGDGQAVSPVGAAVAGGPDAGFDAVRAGGKNFAGGPDALRASDATLAALPGGAPSATDGSVNPPADASTRKLARDAAMTAALTSAAAGTDRSSAPTGARDAAGGGSPNGRGAVETPSTVQAGLVGTSAAPNGSATNRPVSSGTAAANGSAANGGAQPASPTSPGSPAGSPQPGTTHPSDGDPRQVLQASSATSPPPVTPSVRPGVEANGAPSPPRLAGQSSPGTAKPPAAHPTSTPPVAAPRPASGGGFSSRHGGTARATPPPPGPSARPPAPRRARKDKPTGAPLPPPDPSTTGGRSGSTSSPDGSGQSPAGPPAPVSPPENS